ncbi:hypothetical protein I7I50_05856 [Histoplasma capsulatum G186AR]|uniref:Uncharacterized protein n=1 Tax=Ajellomyces capsulatus TaxID=5037 RepID=A0A8H8D817_AJECA|nr:hypothetical protein I7I52_04115 [Histoplasma capsulatum]QSS76412.1 hypothetical protein I7I50_05856 [Histoplasma capsulatum G186AR]
MTGNSSKVGTRGLYAIGDQTNSPRSEAMEAKRNRDHPPLSSRRGSRHLKEQYLAKNGSTLTDEDLAKLDPTAPVSLFFFPRSILRVSFGSCEVESGKAGEMVRDAA